jgi:hypothetical protein
MSQPGQQAAIGRALEFIAARQLPHGEIRVDRAGDLALTDPALESSPYGTTYALHALGFAGDPRIAGIAERALAFLTEEMEPPGLWRYYSSRNPKTLPPDLDDTACAAFALRRHHDEIQLGWNLRVLLANRDREGRFLTFLTGGPNNVDAVVNANVLLWLGEREETRAACDYLVETVRAGREEKASVYGVDELSLDYVLSRAWANGVAALGPCRAPILARLAARRRPDGSYGDELATALAVATLLNFGGGEGGEGGEAEDLAPSVAFLLSRQRPDGSWPRATFYVDFAGGFYGSEELTTAFAVEALARARPSRSPA